MLKCCIRCEKIKPFYKFGRHAPGRFSLRAKCNVCRVAEYSDYRKRNLDKVREWHQTYWKDNKPRLLRNLKRWRKSVCGQASVKNDHIKRRASCKDTDITSKFLIDLRLKTLLCSMCGVHLSGSNMHLDHIIPLCMRGMHCKTNVRYLCVKCNLSRPKYKR